MIFIAITVLLYQVAEVENTPSESSSQIRRKFIIIVIKKDNYFQSVTLLANKLTNTRFLQKCLNQYSYFNFSITSLERASTLSTLVCAENLSMLLENSRLMVLLMEKQWGLSGKITLFSYQFTITSMLPVRLAKNLNALQPSFLQ